MPITRPSLAELDIRIRNDVLSRVTPGEGILRYAFLKIMARVWAGATWLLWGLVVFLSKMPFIETAVDEFLTLKGAEWVGDKLQPTTALGDVVFTGVTGTLVPIGTEVQDPDGVKYDTQANVTMVAGTGTVQVVSQESGLDQNQAAGTALTLVSPIVDIDNDVTVDTTGITGGTDIETDEDYRIRIIDRIQNAPNGGSVNDYKQWVKDALSSATRIWVFPQLQGPGTVGIYFVKDNDTISIIPGAGDLTTVNNFIQDDDRKPAIAEPTALAPALTEIIFTIEVSPFRPDIETAIDASLEAMFLRDGEPGGVLRITRINEAISVAAGEEDHLITGITVGGGAVGINQDIQLLVGRLPDLGTNVYSELT